VGQDETTDHADKWLAQVAALTLIFVAPVATLEDGSSAAAAPPGAPNVLVIVTDDQRTSTMLAMPKTLQWLRGGGVEFREAYVTTPSCCPSRASIFTGRYVHNHGVRQQRLGANLDHRSTLQRQLQGSGYFTGMAGKFLNRWNLGTRPPYFDRYAVANGGYYDTTWGIDGAVRKVATYTTTFIGDKAIQYLTAFQNTNDARPWFLYLATFAPHTPRRPEPKYADATFASAKFKAQARPQARHVGDRASCRATKASVSGGCSHLRGLTAATSRRTTAATSLPGRALAVVQGLLPVSCQLTFVERRVGSS
jgi:arylsulfatase A-like enzyme